MVHSIRVSVSSGGDPYSPYSICTVYGVRTDRISQVIIYRLYGRGMCDRHGNIYDVIGIHSIWHLFSITKSLCCHGYDTPCGSPYIL